MHSRTAQVILEMFNMQSLYNRLCSLFLRPVSPFAILSCTAPWPISQLIIRVTAPNCRDHSHRFLWSFVTHLGKKTDRFKTFVKLLFKKKRTSVQREIMQPTSRSEELSSYTHLYRVGEGCPLPPLFSSFPLLSPNSIFSPPQLSSPGLVTVTSYLYC